MAGRRKNVLDVREMVRRFKLGQSDREVAWEMGSNRRTVAKYRKIAGTEGLLSRPELPDDGEIDTYGGPATSQPKNRREIPLWCGGSASRQLDDARESLLS